jgi:hypothetical protein
MLAVRQCEHTRPDGNGCRAMDPRTIPDAGARLGQSWSREPFGLAPVMRLPALTFRRQATPPGQPSLTGGGR